MRERVPTLLYVVAALVLCAASIVAVRQVRASADARVRAAERAAQEAMRDGVLERDASGRQTSGCIYAPVD